MSARTRQSGAKRRWLRLAAPVLATVLCAGVRGQTISTPQPTTQASTTIRPATRPTHQIKEVANWFGELVHPDAATREQALIQLMGLDASDLPTLREVVKKNQPLAAAQASVLRQVVTQVFLASETYDVGSPQGFLGILLPNPELPDSSEGALVSERMPGFVSMRMLRDGDVILGVQLPAGHAVRVHSAAELTASLTNGHAGDLVRLEILRQGKIINISLHLDPRPAQADIGVEAMRDFNRQRLDQADAYWEKNFASLLRESVSLASPPVILRHAS